METYRASSDVIACTLTPEGLKETEQAWQKLFGLALVSREEVPGGLRLEMHPGSADALRILIEAERDCCRWITFELDGPVVTMTSPGAGEAEIREMWSVAQQVPTGD
jgi:hypothetical protein